MSWLYAVLIGLVLGLAVGYTAEHVPIAPVLQSIAATLVAMILTAISVALLWFLRPPATGDLGAVSIGFVANNLLYIGGVCLTIAVIHVLLGRMGGVAPAVATHRVTVLASIGGLCGALLVTRIMAIATRSS